MYIRSYNKHRERKLLIVYLRSDNVNFEMTKRIGKKREESKRISHLMIHLSLPSFMYFFFVKAHQYNDQQSVLMFS